jgi:hypothetical protein
LITRSIIHTNSEIKQKKHEILELENGQEWEENIEDHHFFIFLKQRQTKSPISATKTLTLSKTTKNKTS